MATPIDGLDEVELTEFTRIAAADFDAFDGATSGTLSDIFPVSPVNDIRYTYSRGVDALIDDAVFRAWDAESSIGRRPGTARVTGELAPISRKTPLSEYAQLRLRGDSQEIIDGVFDDAARLAREVMSRIARARGELITTGKIELDENGIVDSYDSGRDNTLTVGAVSPLWSAASTATPVANVRAWKALVKAQSGITPDTLSVSEAAFAALQVVDEVKDLAFPGGTQPSLMGDADVSRVFAQLAGVELRVRPEVPFMATQPVGDKFAILYKRNVPIGATAMGTPVESTKPQYAGVSGKPGLYAGGWQEDDPMTAWTHVVGIGLPLLGAPDMTLSAEVLA